MASRMATRVRGSWVFVCAAVLGGACMNDYDEFDFPAGGGATAGGSAGVDSGSGGATAGASGAGGSSAGTAGSSGSGGSPGGGGSAGSSGAAASSGEAGTAGGAGSGGEAGGSGAAGSAGAAGGDPTGVVECGATPCTIKTHSCCVTQSQSSCITSGANCPQGTAVACDGPEDCTGKVCCAQLGGGASSYSNFTCRNANECTLQQARIVVCGDDPSVCGGTTNCKASAILPQYRVCSPN
jgi:hypothetical protein